MIIFNNSEGTREISNALIFESDKLIEIYDDYERINPDKLQDDELNDQIEEIRGWIQTFLMEISQSKENSDAGSLDNEDGSVYATHVIFYDMEQGDYFSIGLAGDGKTCQEISDNLDTCSLFCPEKVIDPDDDNKEDENEEAEEDSNVDAYTAKNSFTTIYIELLKMLNSRRVIVQADSPEQLEKLVGFWHYQYSDFHKKEYFEIRGAELYKIEDIYSVSWDTIITAEQLIKMQKKAIHEYMQLVNINAVVSHP